MLPQALAVWHPYDYGLYIEMGNAVRQGLDPIGPRHYYPLPTALWVFAPLSLMPDWFRIVWALVPSIFILVLFRRQGVWLFLFTPIWFTVSDAMLDGWLLLPLKWVLDDRPGWAGVGAVILLVKPQLAILIVAFRVLQWLTTHNWKNFLTFVLALTVFCLPAFVFDPMWIPHLVAVLPMRVGESMAVLPLLTSTVWAWWWLGGSAVIVFAGILIIASVLVWRAWSRERATAAASLQCFNQLLVPVLFASNLVTLLPILRGRTQILAVVIVSLLAYVLDRALNGFGGGYVLVPLAVLYFLNRGQDHLAGETNQ